MNPKTEDYQLNRELILWEAPQSLLCSPVTLVSLLWQGETTIECRLICQFTLDLYQQLDANARFNLKPELRGTQPATDFQADFPVELQVTLKPDLLSELTAHATTAEEAAHYLLQLSQETPDHPLLYTENWLALSVKQQQESGEVGYTTLWATLNPAELASGTISEAELGHKISDFFRDWVDVNLTTITQKATTEMLQGVGNLVQELTEAKIETVAQEMTTTPESILDQVVDFFIKDDWAFTKIQGKTVLQVAFQGEHGRWTCYAEAREEQSQFLFYSMYPANAPEDTRSPIAEFLTRANYGLIIGNFELDFNDGEIRFKTSVDVEDTQLDTALIKNMVYTNVLMMDQYFPGIQAVLEGTSPVEAIRVIEHPDSDEG